MGRIIGRERRLTGMVLAALLCITATLPVFGQNAMNKTLLVEQAKGKAPNVKAYMTGNGMSSSVAVSGSIGDITLTQSGDIRSFADSGEGLRTIVLFDNSGSIDPDQFEVAKEELQKIRKNLGDQDEFVLYTVGTTDVAGEKTDVLGGAAKGSDSGKVSGDCSKIADIEYIEGVEAKTILYRSLNEVLEEQANQTSFSTLRTVILIVTDGEDDSDDLNGKDNDKDSTLKNVQSANVPVYGILLNDTAREPDEEKIKFTKNQLLDAGNCRGYFYNCASGDLPKVKDEEQLAKATSLVTEGFGQINDILKNKTFVVSLLAGSNVTNVGKSELKLTVGDSNVAPFMMDYTDGDTDADAPIAVGIVEQESANSVSLVLKDDNGVNASDAADVSHYVIESDVDGKTWAINQVNVNESGNEVEIILTIEDKGFYQEAYTLTVDGIRDKSQDQNAMKAVKLSFEIENGLDRKAEHRKELIQKYWWILLVILFVIIGVIALIFIKKKAVKVIEKEVDLSELNKADRKWIRLEVTDRMGTTREVTYNVEGSVFVGRSEKTCDIYFDDDRLSRQHFVIEITKMGCNIQDLESKNGTVVNGVKLTAKRLLLDGDVITAGREKFVFHVDNSMQELPDIEQGNMPMA